MECQRENLTWDVTGFFLGKIIIIINKKKKNKKIKKNKNKTMSSNSCQLNLPREWYSLVYLRKHQYMCTVCFERLK